VLALSRLTASRTFQSSLFLPLGKGVGGVNSDRNSPTSTEKAITLLG